MKNRLPMGRTHTSFSEVPYPGRLERIAEQGYEYVDYQNLVNVESDFFRLPMAEFADTLREEKAKMDAVGIRVSQAHAPWRWPAHDGREEDRAAWLEAMKKAVYGCHVLSCPLFVMHPLLPYGDTAEHPEEVLAVNLAFVGAVADFAKTYHITVCVENLPFPEYPLYSVSAVCDLVDALDRKNLAVCLDTGHAAIEYGADIAAAVRRAGSRLKALHIHDNMGKEDQHLLPGAGIIHWDAFAEALKEVGFRGAVSLETSVPYRQLPREQWAEAEQALTDSVVAIAEKAHP